MGYVRLGYVRFLDGQIKFKIPNHLWHTRYNTHSRVVFLLPQDKYVARALLWPIAVLNQIISLKTKRPTLPWLCFMMNACTHFTRVSQEYYKNPLPSLLPRSCTSCCNHIETGRRLVCQPEFEHHSVRLRNYFKFCARNSVRYQVTQSLLL